MIHIGNEHLSHSGNTSSIMAFFAKSHPYLGHSDLFIARNRRRSALRSGARFGNSVAITTPPIPLMRGIAFADFGVSPR
jgi:hypothetical protein